VVEDQIIDYCLTTSIEGGTEQIIINGVNAPWHRISYRSENSSSYIEICNDNCSDSQLIQSLSAGTYIVRIEQSSGGTINYCSQDFRAVVTSEESITTNEESISTSEEPATLCSDVYIYTHPHKIGISGVNATHNKIQLKGPSTQDHFLVICENNCYQNYSYIVVSNLMPGYYTIITEESDDGTTNYCTIEKTIYVSSYSTGNRIAHPSEIATTFAHSTLTLEHIQETDKGINKEDLPVQPTSVVNTTNTPKTNLTVYPNPAQRRLFVDLSVYKDYSISIKIINSVGTLIKEVPTSEQTGSLLEIDLTTSAFSKGIYFLQAQIGKDRLLTEKFIID